jgi:hypothetical protein
MSVSLFQFTDKRYLLIICFILFYSSNTKANSLKTFRQKSPDHIAFKDSTIKKLEKLTDLQVAQLVSGGVDVPHNLKVLNYYKFVNNTPLTLVQSIVIYDSVDNIININYTNKVVDTTYGRYFDKYMDLSVTLMQDKGLIFFTHRFAPAYGRMIYEMIDLTKKVKIVNYTSSNLPDIYECYELQGRRIKDKNMIKFMRNKWAKIKNYDMLFDYSDYGGFRDGVF